MVMGPSLINRKSFDVLPISRIVPLARVSGENFVYVFPIRIEDLKFGGKNSTYPVPSCFTFFSFTDQSLGYETINPETEFSYLCSSCANTRLICCRGNKVDTAIILPIKTGS